MDEARLGPDTLREVREEGDHVVLGLALDLVDARDVVRRRACARSPWRRSRGTTPASASASVAMRLDLEPDAEAVLRLPDGAHLGRL